MAQKPRSLCSLCNSHCIAGFFVIQFHRTLLQWLIYKRSAVPFSKFQLQTLCANENRLIIASNGLWTAICTSQISFTILSGASNNSNNNNQVTYNCIIHLSSLIDYSVRSVKRKKTPLLPEANGRHVSCRIGYSTGRPCGVSHFIKALKLDLFTGRSLMLESCSLQVVI